MEKFDGSTINGIVLIASIMATYYVCSVSPKGVVEDLISLRRGVERLLRPIAHSFIKSKDKKNR
jgi:hypothetical protein